MRHPPTGGIQGLAVPLGYWEYGQVTPNNLPVRLSSFVGRQFELLALHALVVTHRLVTITGSGGAGKTRLALHIAAGSIDQFNDGVWWVELAPLVESEAVATTLAAVVGASLDKSVDQALSAARRLGSGSALVVFDNCEHVSDATTQMVVALLEHCPNVRVLTTSREPLDVSGELTWRVPPLGLPSDDELLDVGRLGQSDAVRLFLDRARGVRPNFSLTDDNSASIAQICRQLDGIPLAIELAAARVKTLSPETILAGLGDALRLLTGGSRRELRRHQTLEASIDWSCALLTAHQRLLLFRLSVFSGSFDLRGAESVCTGDGLDQLDVLDALERLIDHSLVAPMEGDNQYRFVVLETVRQFGARELRQHDTSMVWQSRHAEYYAALAAEFGQRCETADQFLCVATLTTEYDNIRAALAWFRDHRPADRLALMVFDLGPFWDVAGDKVEGAKWASRALELLGSEPTPIKARLTALWAECRVSIGDFKGAYNDANAALRIGEESGDLWSQGRGSSSLTTILAYGDLAAWKPRWDETVRLLTESGDDYALAGTLTWGAVPLIFRGWANAASIALEVAWPVVLATGSPLLAATQRLCEAGVANLVGRPRDAESIVRSVLSSGALGSAPRIAIGEGILSSARGLMGQHRTDPAEKMEFAARARRNGEYLAFDNYTLEAAAGWLRTNPSKTLQLIDMWADERPNAPTMLRCGGAITGAQAAFLLGDNAEASRRVDVGLRLARESQTVIHEGRALALRAAIELRRAETPAAKVAARQAIAVHAEHGNQGGLCEAVEVLACIASACGDATEAARLFGAASALRDVMHIGGGVCFQALIAEATAASKAAGGADEFEAAFAAGAALSVEDTIAFVQRTRGARGRPSLGWNSLTPTELQVVDLVRSGLSNREISLRLLMSAETVKSHLSRIFRKLDVAKRVHLAALATERAAASR